MSYKVAGIDIHKKLLMVVVASAEEEVRDAAGEALEFECRRFGREKAVGARFDGAALDVLGLDHAAQSRP